MDRNYLKKAVYTEIVWTSYGTYVFMSYVSIIFITFYFGYFMKNSKGIVKKCLRVSVCVRHEIR